MLDDEHDSSMARNQLIGMLLMVALLFAWMHFFAPKPGQKPPVPASQTSQTEPAEKPAPPAAESEAAAFLPPVAEPADPASDEVVLEDGDTRAVFTRVGGRLKRCYAKLHLHGEEEVQIVPEPVAEEGPVPDAEAVYPLGLRFSDRAFGYELDKRRFEVTAHTDTEVSFALTLPGVARVQKTYSLTPDKPHVLRVEVQYGNLADQEAPVIVGKDETPAYTLNWAPNVASDDFDKGVRQTVMWRKDQKTDFLETASMKSKNGAIFERVFREPEWLCVKSAYFVVAFKPEYTGALGWIEGKPEGFRFGLSVPRFEVARGDTHTAAWLLYAGPSERAALEAAWDTLPTSLRFFQSDTWSFMDTFSKWLLALLNWFYSIIPSYGIAIIILTVLVRSAMFPLTIKQMRSMKKMQLLAPEIEKLKEKHGEDQQEMNKRMMELYRERGVNPLGGCLPMFLQLPVFIALYRMLWSAYELRGAPFILMQFGDYAWIRDLSEPDRLLHLGLTNLPFVGNSFEYLNILPILGAITMVLSTKLMPSTGPAQSAQQKTMMTIMPVFVSFICYNFASGLNLYILVSTALGIAQNKLISPGKVDINEKRPIRKKRHFYDAARERKRQMAKDATGKHRK